MVPLKRIQYRGGIVCFEIPASWREEYDPKGGATFYEDGPDSGTLRLNVLSFASNGNETEAQTLANVIARGDYIAIPRGLALKEETKTSYEEGEKLLIYYWTVLIPVSSFRIRLAVFSYTILDSQASDPRNASEVELLASSIKNAEYSRQAGVAGNFEHQ